MKCIVMETLNLLLNININNGKWIQSTHRLSYFKTINSSTHFSYRVSSMDIFLINTWIWFALSCVYRIQLILFLFLCDIFFFWMNHNTSVVRVQVYIACVCKNFKLARIIKKTLEFIYRNARKLYVTIEVQNR